MDEGDDKKMQGNDRKMHEIDQIVKDSLVNDCKSHEKDTYIGIS